MHELGFTNAQGSYNAGRGRDGLNAAPMIDAAYRTSRFGTAVPTSVRPASITGKPMPVGWTPAARVPPVCRPCPRKQVTVRNRQQFINWLKLWAPALYADAKQKADVIERAEPSLGQLGGWWDTFTEKLTDIGGKYLQYRTQREILKAQLERMQAGLPPLQTSEYAPTIAFKPDPGTTREITSAIGAGFGKLLPWLAVAGVALVVLMRRKR